MAASYSEVGALVGVQFLVWSVLLEVGQPVVRAVLSMFPCWERYTDLKTEAGGTVWDEIVTNTVVALQRLIGGVLVTAGYFLAAPELLRLGLASEAAFALNDMVLANFGLRRHAGSHPLARGLLSLYACLTIALYIPAAASYAADPDVQYISFLLVFSGTLVAISTPIQYAFNLKVQSMSKANARMQAVVALVFVICRLFLSVGVRSGAFVRVAKMLHGVDPMHSYIFVGSVLGITFTFNFVFAVLLVQRANRSRHAHKKIKQQRMWFEKNAKDTPEKNIQAHIWKAGKISDDLFAQPQVMMSARFKTGGLFRARPKTMAKKKA